MKWKTYHSEKTDCTLNTPQWMNIPILLSSYHVGNGRLSNEAQSGVYCCLVKSIREQKIPIINIHAINEYILSIWNYPYSYLSLFISVRHFWIDKEISYHASASIDGTLNTPQCIKMPTLDWSYQLGNGLVSSDDHSGK
jgi:hypothetical protein